ncbi:MFS transporter [Halobacteriales archaeon QS_8_69_26]|nr:MAG: MFS transporter [Halobacteriales archaeon QS_8_69_26]
MSEEESAGESRARIVALVGGLFVVSAAAAAYEIAPASVTPLVRESLGIGPAAAGWLVSVMFATVTVTSLPAGVALDRVSVRLAVPAAVGALFLAGAWGYTAAAADAYWPLVASRVLGGLAYVVVWNAGATVVGVAVPGEMRATAVGAFTASAPAGFALGQFGAPLVADPLGWPAVLPATAALAVPGLVAFLVATRGQRFEVDADPPDRAAVRRLFLDRGAWTLSVLCFLAFSLYLFLNSWLPSYLVEEVGVSLAVGGLLTAVFPAVGIASRTMGGLVSDRLFGGRRRPVAVLAFALTAPAVAGFLLTTRIPLLVGLVVVAGAAVQLGIGLVFSYVVEVVPASVGTTAVSMLTAVGLFGAFVAPIGAGWVIGRAGYRPVFVVATVVAVLGILVALRAPEAG